jgi:dimethylargininase
MSRLALTRPVGPSIVDCELTHLARSPIDFERATEQHLAYERALAELGCEVRHVAPAPELPDAVFVEDAAVVLDELAVLTRPGAPSRRREVESVAAALAALRPLARIERPGTLDGGDVLRLGATLYVGRTARSNDSGIAQLAAAVASFGYEVRPVEVHGCLHLKTAVTELAPGLLLLRSEWVDAGPFAAFDRVEVHPEEPFGGNILRLGDRLLYAEAFPRTLERIRGRGLEVLTVDASELAKAEGGVTCCSLILES